MSLTFRHRYGGGSLPTEYNTAVLLVLVEQGVGRILSSE